MWSTRWKFGYSSENCLILSRIQINVKAAHVLSTDISMNCELILILQFFDIKKSRIFLKCWIIALNNPSTEKNMSVLSLYAL